MTRQPNDPLADRLDEIADLLHVQGANPYRVRAYRRAAAQLRQLTLPVSQIVATQGVAGLDRLPHIGPSLARTIRDLVGHGYSPTLERLRGENDPARVFASVPGIGYRLAARLHDELGFETLQQVETAAHDGRLEQIAGFGPKRLSGIRATLGQRLARLRDDGSQTDHPAPPVGEFLDVDREYLNKGRAGELRRIAPRRFNPQGVSWLPILHRTRRPSLHRALLDAFVRGRPERRGRVIDVRQAAECDPSALSSASRGYTDIMRHAIALNGPFFNGHRMVEEYALKACSE
jgi:DNA polymerase (family X)